MNYKEAKKLECIFLGIKLIVSATESESGIAEKSHPQMCV